MNPDDACNQTTPSVGGDPFRLKDCPPGRLMKHQARAKVSIFFFPKTIINPTHALHYVLQGLLDISARGCSEAVVHSINDSTEALAGSLIAQGGLRLLLLAFD
jgi:hypothetical protein